MKEKFARIKRTRLAKECAKLDRTFEKAMADEGLTEYSGTGEIGNLLFKNNRL